VDNIIQHTWHFTQPPPEVWAYLTKPELLAKESMTINALAENFDMSRPAVSKHVKVMHHAGFITITDIGRERYCTLKQEGFSELQAFIDFFDTFWISKLKKLETLLQRKAKGLL
jgi:DNA-binding transcriptional regulator GbsR (MarR family)